MEKVKLANGHDSVTSQETIEMEVMSEYSDEEDEVFVKGNLLISIRLLKRYDFITSYFTLLSYFTYY